MVKMHLRRSFLICVGVTLLVLGIYVFGGFDAFELKTVDLRFQLRGNRPFNKDIVIVTVDEKSIEEMGRWPWPRATHGTLARKLAQAGAKVVACDTLFTEPDKSDRASDGLWLKRPKTRELWCPPSFLKGGWTITIWGGSPCFPIRNFLRTVILAL